MCTSPGIRLLCLRPTGSMLGGARHERAMQTLAVLDSLSVEHAELLAGFADRLRRELAKDDNEGVQPVVELTTAAPCGHRTTRVPLSSTHAQHFFLHLRFSMCLPTLLACPSRRCCSCWRSTLEPRGATAGKGITCRASGRPCDVGGVSPSVGCLGISCLASSSVHFPDSVFTSFAEGAFVFGKLAPRAPLLHTTS